MKFWQKVLMIVMAVVLVLGIVVAPAAACCCVYEDEYGGCDLCVPCPNDPDFPEDPVPSDDGCLPHTYGVCHWSAQNYWRCPGGCIPCWSEENAPNLISDLNLEFIPPNSLLVTWDAIDTVYAQMILWWIEGESSYHIGEGVGSAESFHIHNIDLNKQIIVRVFVDGYTYMSGRLYYVTGIADCPNTSVSDFFDPTCQLTPASTQINVGESAALTMAVSGGTVDRVEFSNLWC